MRCFITTSLLMVLSGTLMHAATAQASQPGTPPANLPEGSAYLDPNPRLAKTPSWVPGPGYRAYPFVERNRDASFAAASGTKSPAATPIQLPLRANAAAAKRPATLPLSRAAAQNSVRIKPAPATLPIPLPKPAASASLRLPPRPAITPIPLPKPAATSSLRLPPRPAATPINLP
jgi:hypothetical protein